jgi:hypothetical protein
MRVFPGLPLDLFGFDLVELRTFDSRLVSTATPDWVLYLAAAAGHLTGLITHDARQLQQELEVRALELTGITLVTYRPGVQDELTKWGLLMAYAPKIQVLLDRSPGGAIVLPEPRSPEAVPVGKLYREIKAIQGDNAQVIRTRADREMQARLNAQGLHALWPTRS